MKIKNYYDTLEVSPRAREVVINAAYRALMKYHYPDGIRGDGRIARTLNDAKDNLLDKGKRSIYDMSRTNIEGKVIGEYRVLEKIAEGGFGSTYRGEQLTLHAPVCIKHAHQISPQDEEILIEEANSIWDLRHYGIPAMRDLIKLEDGSPALVMSYVKGPTLEQIVSKAGGLDPEHVAWISERMLNVLKYLHYNGVVHGDVKPQNVIIEPESHNIVLVDYGLSLIRPSNTSGSKGYTPFFASPEQEKGMPLIPESDFYGMGMTMIYALGGDVKTRKVPESVPDPLCRLIKRFIVYNPLSRPNWSKEDLVETVQDLRQKVFGRRRSKMKPLPEVG